MKKLFSTLVIATTLTAGATVALADTGRPQVIDHDGDRARGLDGDRAWGPGGDRARGLDGDRAWGPGGDRDRPRSIDRRPAVAPRAERDVLAARRAPGRAGSLTFELGRPARGAELALMVSDPRLDIRRVLVTFASGRTVRLAGTSGRALELPEQGRIVSVKVAYVNRGARDAVIRLIATGGRDPRDVRPDRPGRFGLGG